MAKQKKKPVVELNDDINWDYDSYQGRSKRQVFNNETVAYYAVLSLAGFGIGLLLYWIFSSM
ncbi:MAG: hypothetical protein EBW68_07525 [Actinobacteria bacterium]|jgi:hypothetical protein|nr:hypothetical protein [Actinomycetota bacterium]